MVSIETIPYRKSLKYRLMDGVVGILPIKRMMNVEGEKLEKLVRRFEKSQSDDVREKNLKGKVDYRVEQIAGRPCVIAKKTGSQPDRAILLFFGGGFFMPPDDGDYYNIAEFADDTNSEIWFPLYPLAPKYSMKDMIESVTGVYEEMLKTWPGGKILFMGNSSGAANCLYICMYIRKEGRKIPFPAHLIMLSPGLYMPPTEKQLSLMQPKEKSDHMIPVLFCRHVEDVLLKDHPELDYLAKTFDYDWTGFPSMDVFFGTSEVFSAFVDDLALCAEKYSVDINIHLGEGMMHCWPQIYQTREGRDGRERIKQLIRKEAWR